MRQLAATVRHRPAPLIGTFVALFVAGLIATWAFSVGLAGDHSSVPADRLAGAAAVVVGDQNVAEPSKNGPASKHGQPTTDPLTSFRRVPADLAVTLARVPGVQVAVADRSIPVALALASGRVAAGSADRPHTGYGWDSAALTPFVLRSGHAPAGADQIVLGAGLARSTGLGLGDRVRLAGRPLGPLTVVGLAASPERRSGPDPAGSSTVFFSTAEADALYGHSGQADLIGVVARPGADPAGLVARLRAALPGAAGAYTVLTGDHRGSAEDVTAARDFSNLGALVLGAGIDIVLMSLFVVAGTVALSIGGRGRTVALLRAVGATPGQVRRSVMAELAVLGAVAGLAAYRPGIWLASWSVRGLAAHQFVPASTRAWVSPLELLPAVGGAIVIAELAGVLAARRAARTNPGAALVEAAVERRFPRLPRLGLGLAALGGGGVLAVMALQQKDASQQLNQALMVLLAFMAGVALLGPYLVALAELALRVPLHLLGGPTGRLATAQVRARSRRMASAAVAIALPVAFAGAISVVDDTQIHAATSQSRGRLAASAVVQAPGPGLDPSVLTAVRSTPGVTGAVGVTPTTVYVPWAGSAPTTAEAVTDGPLPSVLRLDVTAGSLARFGPGDIALSTLEAGKGALGVHVGQTINTALADGTPYRATVRALFARSMGFADAIVPTAAAGGGHLGTTTLTQVLVDTGPNRTGTAALSALGARYPGLTVADGSVANAQAERDVRQQSYANNLLLGLVGLLAAIALVNTLVLTTLQGGDELTLLHRVGATTRQLLAMTAWEAGAVTVVGIVLGVGAAGAGVAAVAKAFTGTWVPTVTVATTAHILGPVVGLTLLAMLIPAGAVLRRAGAGR